MMAKPLTHEQKQALDLQKHIALNANAGSGKTTVLVERYMKILEEFINSENEGLGPRNIVAITFTNKSASEMQSRVIAKFHEKYDELLFSDKVKKDSLINLKKIREFRDKLTSARISTIHSFCLELISRYPVESRIPINFREISQAERLALIDQAFNSVIDEWLSDQSSGMRKMLMEILVQIDISELKDLTVLTISNNHLLEYLYEFYNQGFERSSKLMFDYLKNTYIKPGLNLFDFISRTLECEKIEGINFPGSSELNMYRQKVENSTFEVLLELNFWETLKQFFYSIFKKDLDIKKKVKEKLGEKISESIRNNVQYSKPFIELVESIIQYNRFRNTHFNEKENFWLEQMYFGLSKNIFSFITEVYEKFQFLKYDEGLLDFNDMLLFAYLLLKENPDVVQEILKEIKFVLVDEFQDTDELQYQIVKSLITDLSGDSQKLSSPNLFVVGDGKQSIYSFRNADVRIFERIKIEISEANRKKYKIDGEQGILKLSYTFRLHPEISAFVDAVFGKLMLKNEFTTTTDFHIPYEQFIIPKSKFKNYFIEISNQNKKHYPRVKFLLHIKSSQGVAEEESEEFTEDKPLARKIARHIKLIIENEDYQILDRELNVFRKITFSDIAIISRKINDLASLISILSEEKIPFVFRGMRNFFSATEIVDFISFLKFLMNPNDDVAFAGILRSIFFEFPDEWLINIATVAGDNISFWEKFNLAISKTEGGEIEFKNENVKTNFLDSLRSTKQVLTKLLKNSPSLPLNEIIQSIIKETNWFVKIRKLSNYEQILANVEELLDYARDYMRLGFRTVYDFIEQIDYANQHGIAEGDRFGVVATNAIQLLTIHSVKGLEFPVVYVFNIDSGTRKIDNFLLSKDFGIAFPMKVYTSDRKFAAKTLQYLVTKYHSEAEREAEEIRILYVALTRASEYLILTGTANEKEINESLDNQPIETKLLNVKNEIKQQKVKIFKFKGALERILSAINFDDNLVSSGRFPLSVKIFVGDESTNEVSTETLNFHLEWIIHSLPDVDLKFKPILDLPESSNDNHFLLNKIDFPLSQVVISPTKLLTYLQDKNLFLKRYFLGFPDELTRLDKSVFEEDYEFCDHIIIPSMVGNLVHYCLQNVDRWIFKGNINYEELIRLISNYFHSQERLAELEMREIVVQQCLNVVQTPLFKQNFEEILISPKEYEILMPIADNYLIGKVDLLLNKSNGEREIWDWKTNNISKDDLTEVAKNYEFQMKTYAYLLSHSFPDQDYWVAYLLFTRLAKPNINNEDWTFVFRWSSKDLIEFEKFILENQNKISNLLLD